MAWLTRLLERLTRQKRVQVEAAEKRTEEAVQEAERVQELVAHYRRMQDALRR